MLINKIKELASDALVLLSQSNQELLQQRRNGITKNLSREYKALKHNVLPKKNCYLVMILTTE